MNGFGGAMFAEIKGGRWDKDVGQQGPASVLSKGRHVSVSALFS